VVSSTEFYRVVRKLFASRWTVGRTVRLIGVGLGSLEESGGPEQGDLFEAEAEKQGKVEKALADLRKKHPGAAPVVRASLLGTKGHRPNPPQES
jgi:hypothetical protein